MDDTREDKKKQEHGLSAMLLAHGCRHHVALFPVHLSQLFFFFFLFFNLIIWLPRLQPTTLPSADGLEGAGTHVHALVRAFLPRLVWVVPCVLRVPTGLAHVVEWRL